MKFKTFRNYIKLNYLFLFSSFVVVFYPVFKRLIETWGTSDDYSHGFFIIPISIYIIWSKKETLAKITIKPSNFGLLLIAVSLILYMIAIFAEIITLAPICMVVFLFGIVLYLYGLDILKELLFPLFFLFFMIPIPAQIYSAATIPLQLLVSKISVNLASLINIPIFREGNVIELPGKTLQVVQACSGLRSIISLLTLSAIFGYLTLQSNLLRTVLFFIGIPIAVFVNIIRVFLMIISFYYFKYDLTAESVHTIFGILIFGIALFIIFLSKKVLTQWDK